MSNARTLAVLGLVAAVLASAGCASRREVRSAPGPSERIFDPAAASAQVSGTEANSLTLRRQPPALRHEEVPPAPSLHHAWIPGSWRPDNGDWEWVPGRWEAMPAGAAEWVPSRVEDRGGSYEWTEGHWR